MRLYLHSVALALLLGANTVAQAATTYNLAADFSGTMTGAWRYGFDADAVSSYELTLFDTYSNLFTGFWPDPSFALGYTSSSHNVSVTPDIWRNFSATETAYAIGPGEVSLHPGPGASELAIVRFVAPTTGTYALDAQFGAGDFGDTTAWIVRNDNFASPWASLGDTGTSPRYQGNLSLTAGETVDFVVGNSGQFYGDSTPLHASFTLAASVPEPASSGLLVVGLGALVLRGRRRAGASPVRP